jgi:hypothetical protein
MTNVAGHYSGPLVQNLMLRSGYSQELSDLFVARGIHLMLAMKMKFKTGSKIPRKL